MQFSKAMGACMCVTVRVVIYFISFLLTKSKCPNHSHHFGLGCASYIQLGASLLRQTQSVSLYFEPKFAPCRSNVDGQRLGTQLLI